MTHHADKDPEEIALTKGIQKGIEYEMKFRWHRLMKAAAAAPHWIISLHLQNAAIEVATSLQTLPWKTDGE